MPCFTVGSGVGGRQLRRGLLATELPEPLRDQALLGEQAYERDGECLVRAVLLVKVVLIDVFGELLRVRDLAHRHLSLGRPHDVGNLVREHIRILLLVVLDRLKQDELCTDPQWYRGPEKNSQAENTIGRRGMNAVPRSRLKTTLETWSLKRRGHRSIVIFCGTGGGSGTGVEPSPGTPP